MAIRKSARSGHATSAARSASVSMSTVFVQRMGAVADRAKPVEGRDPERSGEVAVRPATRPAFGQLPPRTPARRRLRLLCVDARTWLAAFQRRTDDPAGRLNGRPTVDSAQRAEGRGDLARRGGRRHPDVDGRPGLVRNDVSSCRPPDTCTTLTEIPRARSCSALKRAGSGAPVPARRSRLSAASMPACAATPRSGHLIGPASFPRRLDRTAGQRRLEDQDRAAAARLILNRRPGRLRCRPPHRSSTA